MQSLSTSMRGNEATLAMHVENNSRTQIMNAYAAVIALNANDPEKKRKYEMEYEEYLVNNILNKK